LNRLGGPPVILKHASLDAPQIPPMLLPLLQLSSRGLLKRTGNRTFEVTPNTGDDGILVEMPDRNYTFNVGEVLRATEPVTNQKFIPAVADLARIRAERSD